MPAKTSEQRLQFIRDKKAEGLGQTAIAKLLGVSQPAIGNIVKKHGITGWPIGAAARDQKGIKNPNYKNGLSRATVARKSKSTLLKVKRDLHTCERCGYKRDIPLPVHHKDRNRSNNNDSNLEVLCVSCHNKEHMSERVRTLNGTFVI